MAIKGSFNDVSLGEWLQLMQLARKTGRLEVSHENKWAMIIFREGEVWHVEPRGFRGKSGEEVLYALMAMPEGAFTFQRLQVLPALERTINMSIENLLMEGAKRLDEEEAYAHSIEQSPENERAASMLAVLTIAPGAESKVRFASQQTKRVLMAIDGERTIGQVVELSELEHDQAAAIIQDLIEQGVIKSKSPAKT